MPVRFPVPARAGASPRSAAALVAGVGKAVTYAVTGVSVLAVIVAAELPAGSSLLAFISDGPFGETGLILLAAGLIIYGLWVTANALLPFRSGGRTAFGKIAMRGILLCSGLAHGALAYMVVAAWADREVVTRRCCALSIGGWLPLRPDIAFFGIVGTILVAWGASRFGTAASRRLTRSIERLALPSGSERGVLGLARGAVAARGLSFGLAGIHVLLLVFQSSVDRILTLRLIERSFWERPWLAGAVALGLLVYAAYEVVIARFRLTRP